PPTQTPPRGEEPKQDKTKNIKTTPATGSKGVSSLSEDEKGVKEKKNTKIEKRARARTKLSPIACFAAAACRQRRGHARLARPGPHLSRPLSSRMPKCILETAGLCLSLSSLQRSLAV